MMSDEARSKLDALLIYAIRDHQAVQPFNHIAQLRKSRLPCVARGDAMLTE